jgi:hypothetical protein
MAKVRLELGAELDLLTKNELADALHHAGEWQRQAAFGLRHMELPVMHGTPSGGTLTLLGGQGNGPYVGPRQGYYWRIERVSIYGLATGDSMNLFKSDPSSGRFVTTITAAAPAYHPGGRALLLKPGDYLAATGTGLTATGDIRVVGELVSVPGPLMWKLLG